MFRLKLRAILWVVGFLFFISCAKNEVITPDSVYVPTTADVTSKATLAELQQGRTLFVSKCGECHVLYSPDGFSANSWSGILVYMIPKTGLSAADAALLQKYVTRGK